MLLDLVLRGERLRRVQILRVALVVPRAQLRDMLIRVASFGWVDLDQGQTVDMANAATTPLLVPVRPHRCVSAFDAELDRQAARAVDAGPATALLGWVPAPFLDQLAAELAPVAALVVVVTSRGRSKVPRLRRRLTRDGSYALMPARPTSKAAPANVSRLRGRTGLVAIVARLVRRGRHRLRHPVPGRDRQFRPWRLPPEDGQAPEGRADRQAAS